MAPNFKKGSSNGVGKHQSQPESQFGDHLVKCLRDHELELDEFGVNLIRSQCKEFESLQSRLIEEKELIIGQLKQNLMQITDKRLRSSTNNGNAGGGAGGQLTAELTKNSLDFILKDKDAEIESLKEEILAKEAEIKKLKTTIKEQDDVILSHNNNIYVRAQNGGWSLVKVVYVAF